MATVVATQPSFYATALLNPGNGLFPWMTPAALMYQSYVFNKLRMVYKTTASNLSSGSILLYYQEEISAAPETFLSGAATRCHAVGPIRKSLVLNIPTPKNRKFVTTATMPSELGSSEG